MLWNVTIDPTQSDQLSKSITVEADNWHVALSTGLKQHGNGHVVLANLNCKTDADKTVTVEDTVTRCTYRLKPFKPSPLKEKTMESTQTDTTHKPLHRTLLPSDKNRISINLDDLPEHEIFFEKNDSPKESGGIVYRERRIAVTQELDKTTATKLVTKHYETLKALNGFESNQIFISINLFDHVFDDKEKRPPITSLTYKSWQAREPRIIYPLSGDKGEIVTAASRNTPAKTRAKAKTRLRRKDPAALERTVSAFEAMQGLFSIKKHDEAAKFVLELARKLIPCEAGECLLVSPKKYVFYVSSVSGPISPARVKTRVPMMEGIIGFASKNSVVLNIEDAETDERFVAAIDKKNGLEIKNILISPMQFEGETVGVLELLNCDSDNGFSEVDANILSYISSVFAEFATISLPSRQAGFTNQDFTFLPFEHTAPPPKEEKGVRSRKKVSAPVLKKRTSDAQKQKESKTADSKPNTSSERKQNTAAKPSQPEKAVPKKRKKIMVPVTKKRKIR